MTLNKLPPFSSVIIPEVPRLLNLLDRNPASSSFGCFDRPFWLHRTKDFASSTAQMSMWTLALLYKHPFPGNNLYQIPAALEWTLASLEFAISIQHDDGSFDEWYPNERGWAGPTAYVAHTMLQTLEELKSEIPDELKTRTLHCIYKAAQHLSAGHEGDILANHVALALTVLKQAEIFFKEDQFKKAFDKYFLVFKSVQSNEGWSLEYDGADPGYLLGTMNFLTDLDKIWPDPQLKEIVQNGFSFLKYFIVPDGTWGGALGSRHTCHPYFYALEYWSEQFPEASLLKRYLQDCFAKNQLLNPGDQEDPYLHYRMADYLRAELASRSTTHVADQYPYLREPFAKDFKEAKVYIQNTATLYILIAYGRGGAIRIYNKESKKLLLANNGFCAKKENDPHYFSTLWQQAADFIVSDQKIEIQSRAQRIFNKKFNPISLVLFRLASFAVIHGKLAYYLKKLIRFFLITKSPTHSLKLNRILTWNEKGSVKIQDTISGFDVNENFKLYWGGEFHTRFVPQGVYTSAGEVAWRPHQLESQKKSELVIEQVVDSSSHKIDVCAQ